MLAVLSLVEFGEFRGELAFARFRQVQKLADKTRGPTARAAVVRHASAEAELIMFLSRGNVDALWDVTAGCLQWTQDGDLDPLLRLRVGEVAHRAALLATVVAPSDYESWLWLARTHASLGLPTQSRLCLDRAQELAPPGMAIGLFSA